MRSMRFSAPLLGFLSFFVVQTSLAFEVISHANPLPGEDSHHISGGIFLVADVNVQPNSVNATNFLVHGSQSGYKQGTYIVFGQEFGFFPDEPFLNGERISVSLTSNILSQALAENLDPINFGFFIRAEGCSNFVLDESVQNLSLFSGSVRLGDLDNDGDLDAFLGNVNGPNQVLFNLGNGVFTNSGQNMGIGFSRGVALGDLDGDGDLDAFVANDFTASLIWTNNGSGVFGVSTQTLGAFSSYAVELGDLDADGDLDAFLANNLGPNRVYLNDGLGNLIDSLQMLPGTNSHGLDLGDVDGDGDLDAFIVNYLQPDLILTNRGDGFFFDSGQVLSSAGGEDVALADLNGDFSLDAFVAQSGGPNLVYTNDGSGFFITSGQALGGLASHAVRLGDIDGDMDLDAFVGNMTASNRLWLNDGLAGFVDAGVTSAIASSWALDVGDLDGDTDVDLYVGNLTGSDKVWMNRQAVDIFIRKGVSKVRLAEGLLLNYSITAINTTPCDAFGVVISDLLPAGVSFVNADSDAYDPLTGNWNVGTLGIGSIEQLNIGARADYLSSGDRITNTASLVTTVGPFDTNPLNSMPSAVMAVDLIPPCPPGRFTPGSFYGVNAVHALELEDLDRDGDADAIIGFQGVANWVLMNQGDGTFLNSGEMLGSFLTEDFCVGDFNSDGFIDLFEAVRGGGNQVYLRGFGSFINTGQNLGVFDSTSVDCGDLNGDNSLDVVIANIGGQPNQVYYNDGMGNFSNALQNLGLNNSTGVKVGDLDGDEDLDAFIVNAGQPNEVWFNQGDGTFLNSGQVIGLNSNSSDVALGDLDGDGDLDAFVSNGMFGGAPESETVWLNNGMGVFSSNGQTLPSWNSSSVDLGDMDGDGDLDAVVGTWGDPDFIAINDGTGQFTYQHSYDNFFTADVRTQDLDGDGDLDMFAGNQGQGSQVYYHETDIDLEVVKTSSLTNVPEGAAVTFTLLATNHSPCLAENIIVADILPAGLTFVSAGSPDYNPGTQIWTIGDLWGMSSTSLTIDVTVNTGTVNSVITNIAQIQIFPVSPPGGPYDSNLGNNTDEALLNVLPGADIALTKSGLPPVIMTSSTITYTIWVTNSGPNGAAGTEVVDVPSAGTTFDAAASDPGWVDNLTNLTFSLGSIPLGFFHQFNPRRPGQPEHDRGGHQLGGGDGDGGRFESLE